MTILRRFEKHHDKMLEMYNAGHNDVEIADAVGYKSSCPVYKWRMRNGLPAIHPQHRASKIRPHQDTVMQMRAEGAVHREIADAIGVSESGIAKFLASVEGMS